MSNTRAAAQPRPTHSLSSPRRTSQAHPGRGTPSAVSPHHCPSSKPVSGSPQCDPSTSAFSSASPSLPPLTLQGHLRCAPLPAAPSSACFCLTPPPAAPSSPPRPPQAPPWPPPCLTPRAAPRSPPTAPQSPSPSQGPSASPPQPPKPSSQSQAAPSSCPSSQGPVASPLPLPPPLCSAPGTCLPLPAPPHLHGRQLLLCQAALTFLVVLPYLVAPFSNPCIQVMKVR